ncbi:hypothetical protein [Roseibium sp. RKSG952]|uniref:hypothetical protein n=1 Tax=Roseibium sp. RKSG952 TaxID=2529384 RepID=UPI0012BD371B|nr:hypothetical protein [Roseibium sp. RKSG952]MTH95366.1 hypothetical protein [Roseibium sp. RKSG952]
MTSWHGCWPIESHCQHRTLVTLSLIALVLQILKGYLKKQLFVYVTSVREKTPLTVTNVRGFRDWSAMLRDQSARVLGAVENPWKPFKKAIL